MVTQSPASEQESSAAAAEVRSTDGPRRSVRGSLNWWQFASFAITHVVCSWMLAVSRPAGFYRFGRMFGTVEWLINHKRRRRFVRILKRILEHEPTGGQRRRITREYFMRSRCDRMFYLLFDRMLKCGAADWLTIGNRERFERELSRGQGVYVALAHEGDHHALGMLFAQTGYPSIGVRDRNEGPLRRFVQERFARVYPEVPFPRILFADAFPRELYRVLRRGDVFMSLMDVARVRAAHQKMQTVRMFGEDREFVTGPLRIAIRCKSPVFQAFFRPLGNFRYRFDIVGPLLDPGTVTDEESAVTETLSTYAANVENFMRDHPELVSRT